VRVVTGAVRWLAAAVVAVVALAPASARGDFKEWSIALEPGYSMIYVDSRAASGGGAGVDVGFGVTESLEVHAHGFVGWHSLGASQTAPGGTVSTFAAMAGVRYTLDVIRLVPAFDVSVGVLGARGGGDFGSGANPPIAPSTAAGIALGFTLDYVFTRHVAAGLFVKYYALLTDLTRIPVYLFIGPRVEFRFGG
jgi:hypothetical protein